MTWEDFEQLLAEKRPNYYVTQVTAPTLTNDMRGTFLARCLGARTIAFGTHVTPMPLETMEAFPTLDYVLRGEPELTLRELLDTLEERSREAGRGGDRVRRDRVEGAWTRCIGMRIRLAAALDPSTDRAPAWQRPRTTQHATRIPARRHQGLVWRETWRHDRKLPIRVNPDRPFIRDLDDLPLPLHHLLPWDKYRAPNIRGPYTFIVPSRGCPAGCTFCIKHVSYRLLGARPLARERAGRAAACSGTWACATCTCTPTCSPSTASR